MKRTYVKSGKYSKKAGTVTNDVANYSSILFTGEKPIFNMSAKDLVLKNTGWPAICSTKLAAVMSSIELKLYYATNGEELMVDTRSVPNDRQELIKKSMTNRNYTVKNADNIVEIEDHPLKKLLYNVNGRMNYADFIGLNEQYIDTIGNSYNLIEFEDDTPVALYPLLGENIDIDVGDPVKGTIKKYVYSLGNKKYNYDPKEILHFVNYVPGNNVFGKGSMELCLAAILRENYYDMYEYYLCKNFALPSFIANWKTHKRLSEKEKMDLMKQFHNRFGNVKNAGKPIITEAEALEIIKLDSANLRDMNFFNGRKANLQIIAGAYGVPTDLIDTSDSNRASALTAIVQFLEFTIFPKMNKFCEILNQNLVPWFDDSGKLFVYFDNTIPTDPEVQSKTLEALTRSKILTINEARNIMGYASIEEEEVVEDVEPVKPAETMPKEEE